MEENQNEWDVIIIGAGPAGLTAGIYSVRGGHKTLILEKALIGGQVSLTDSVENYPGFISIDGQELTKKMKEQAEHYGAKIQLAEVKKIIKKENEFELETDEGKKITKSIIVATGSTPRFLNVPGEKELFYKGIHTCALCDGHFYKDKEIVIIGGGDSAVKEAIYLSNICKKITIIHRRDTLRAENAWQEKAKQRTNIEYLWNSEVMEFLGENKLEKIKIKNNKTNQETEMKIDGAFIYIGLIPQTKFTEVEKSPTGHIKVSEHMETSEKGIYAAGDCITKSIAQITTCVGEGAIAATFAGEYVDEIKTKNNK